MNDDTNNIANIGEFVIYNGNIPIFVSDRERNFIEDNLEIEKPYKVKMIREFSDGIWYAVIYKDNYMKYIPEESIYKHYRDFVRTKYNLR